MFLTRTWRLVGALLLTSLSVNPLASEPPINWRGDWQQGALLLGTLAPGYRLQYEGKTLKTTEEGQLLFGLGRDASAKIEFDLLTPDGNRLKTSYEIAGREYRIQKVEGVPQRTVTPPPEQLERIRKEGALVAAARRGASEDRWFLDGFEPPLDGPVTGVYGSQRFYNGVPKNPHYGVDYAAPTGTVVNSPATGTVRMVHRDMFYSGGTLIIDHGHGLTSSFLHLSDVLVSEGQLVKRGEPIAKVGATGRATGPHLDWRMNWGKTRIDPQLVLQHFPAQP